MKTYLLRMDDNYHKEIKVMSAMQAMSMDLFIKNAIDNYLKFFLDQDHENQKKGEGVYRTQSGLKKH